MYKHMTVDQNSLQLAKFSQSGWLYQQTRIAVTNKLSSY